MLARGLGYDQHGPWQQEENEDIERVVSDDEQLRGGARSSQRVQGIENSGGHLNRHLPGRVTCETRLKWKRDATRG